MPTALITGVNGQDGSYLAEFLLGRRYVVIGTVRPGGGARLQRIAHLLRQIEVIELGLSDSETLENVIRRYAPDEVYNLAARASGLGLWDSPVATGEINGLFVTRLLEAIHKVDAGIRFCQASSSEIFGNAVQTPQDEMTPFRPRNPYGAAKVYAQSVTANYRDIYGLFAGSAILFNHESPRRTLDFVSRKITYTAAAIKRKKATELRLGNLAATRDWGFAGDYVEAMWRMLQHSTPGDYVIATGKSHSVRDFCEKAFSCVDLDYRHYVTQDQGDQRSPETTRLVGNPAKAKRELDWEPAVGFEELIKIMVDADLMADGPALQQVATAPAGECDSAC